MRRQALVCGMFRSGTTLLSRMLGADGRALVVADPCIYVLKAYRRALARELGLADFDPEAPTSDLFRSPHPALDRAILEGDLSTPVSADDLAWLRHQLRTWKAEQHPRLCAHLDRVVGATFTEVWTALLELAADLYGGSGLELVGTKVSWCEEYLPALARALPDLRVVLLVRDVRGVVASQNSVRGRAAGKRPLLFYARHWRKHVRLAEELVEPEGALAGRAVRVRYEDLVADPEGELRRVAPVLGLDFDPRQLEVERFRDEGERPGWRTNSSFAAPGDGIYADSTARWRSILSADEVRALESLCGPELEACGYACSADRLDPLECLALDCEPRPEELSPWLVGDSSAAYLTDAALRRREYAAESERLAASAALPITGRAGRTP